MDDGQPLLAEQRFKHFHGRMKGKPAIEIDRRSLLLGWCDKQIRPRGLKVCVIIRSYCHETIHGTALKDADEYLLLLIE